jgi:hypothetical protein
MKNNKLLTVKELAVRWSMSVNTLNQWRHERKGPAFIKLGGVRYPLDEVLKFEKEKIHK